MGRQRFWGILMLAALLWQWVSVVLPSDGAAEYVRPPTRGIVSTRHQGSEADPQQVHISLAGSDHVKISWITEDKKVKSLIEYGKEPGNYIASVTGEDTTYRFFFYTSGKIHHVKIGPLQPNTTYYYRCGGVEKEFQFKTPPSTFPIRFAVAGDLGQTEWTATTLEHIGRWEHDVFLLPGDLSYADTHQRLWDSFGRLVQPLASRRPWMVTQGNHEIEHIPLLNHPGPFKSYNSRWQMPYHESTSPSNLYYSFDAAGVHVLMLASYADFRPASPQFQWLQANLRAVDRRSTPWLIALLHAPWYNTNAAHEGEGEAMRLAMEPLLYQARVDMVFAGHVHAYERFTRVYNNSADPCGPIYITIGDGGNREGLAMEFKTPPSPLSVFREASFGHGQLNVENETHAYWSWQRNADSDSAIGDEVWLERASGSERCNNIQTSPSVPASDDEL